MKKSRRAKWPNDTAARIQRMLADGCPWWEIGASFGVAGITVLQKAKALGVYQPRIRRFTDEEDAAIRAGYINNEDLNEVAARLGRKYGDIYQRILRKFPEILNTVRTTRGTKALKRYGRDVLALGASPDEAAQVVRERVIAASAAARVAAMQAKAKRRAESLALMLDKIANGMDRNRAIFEARMLGTTLEEIAGCFDITRERVRQICDAVAFNDAMNATAAKQEDSNTVGAA